ncbi:MULTISPECIES: RecX family transcriptional regulator [Dasania]|uniref:RecX family transcriptional regulator n=1 Tax=Dasania TaxID=503005 RepID=UPI0022A71D24|nr:MULTISPECIES: RecX family transcriptional regulator [Dasania]MCZ0869631.1 RecX family transcriptional regulator [Dasania phycosphaerae]
MIGFVEGFRKEKEKTPADIRYAAIKLLVRREQSLSELTTKLTRKFPGSKVLIEQELEELAEEGLQDDLRYVEMVVRSGINKYHGPLRIRAELRQKKLVTQSLMKPSLKKVPIGQS